MSNSYNNAEKLDVKQLKKIEGRRDFLKTVGISAGIGTVGGGLSYMGLDYAGGYLKGIFNDVEKQVRELAHDVKILSGSLERKLANETKELKEHYTGGKLKIYEELKLADPAELAEFEKIIENSENFEKHYDFAERSRIFKDRIDRKLLGVDNIAESYQPETLRKINDAIRSFFGKKSGEEGMNQRNLTKSRLDSLIGIYNTNENNRIAETKVMSKLNDYLGNSNLPAEERELYLFMKEKYKNSENSNNLREFIEDYNKNDGRNQALIRLRASLTQAEENYEKINENKEYLQKLQGLLIEGIELKQNVRKKSQEEFANLEEQVNGEIVRLRGSVNTIIADLEEKGYDIETREEIVNKTTLSKYIEPIVLWGSVALGSIMGAKTFGTLRRKSNMRASDQALEKTVYAHNELVDKLNNQEEKVIELNDQEEKNTTEKVKNPNYPEYIDGDGI